MTLSDASFNNIDADGMLIGHIFFENGYGLSFLTVASERESYGFDVTFLKRSAGNPDVSNAELDAQLLTVSSEVSLTAQTDVQVNDLISLIENLSAI